MRYTIFKGCHYSWPLFKFGLNILGRSNEWQGAIVSITFNETNVYDFGDNPKQGDTNKLFGFSQGFHQTNSARVGWRYDKKDNKIHICYYAYENGKNIINGLWKDVCAVELNSTYVIKLSTVRLDSNTVTDSLKVLKDSTFEVIGEYVKTRNVKQKVRIGYYLTPYFGGTMRAPHKMKIDMKWY